MPGIIKQADGTSTRRVELAHQVAYTPKVGATSSIFDGWQKLEPLFAERFADDGTIIVRVLEHPRSVIGAVADQHCDPLSRPVRRQRSAKTAAQLQRLTAPTL